MAGLFGIVVDSIHGGVLVGAVVSVAGTDRQGISDSTGKFRIDSIPPGSYRLALFHPLLDSIGLAVGTVPIDFAGGRFTIVAIGTPSPATLGTSFCPPEKRITGTGLIIGRVLDADTDDPAPGVKVSFVWSQLEAGRDIGLRRLQRLREAVVDASGSYHLCGIPAGTVGSVRATTPVFATADIPVDLGASPVTIVTLHVARPDTTPIAVKDTAHVATGVTAPAASTPAAPARSAIGLRHGHSIVSGIVVNAAGRPVPGADVTVQGAASTTVTDSAGRFTLRGLPSGTQTLVVRRVSFAPIGMPVEVTARAPLDVTVKLAAAPPQLQKITVTAKWEQELKKIGFTDRQKTGQGHYLTRDQIEERLPQVMTDVFETMPGITVDYSSGSPVLKGSRSAGGSCVNYVIDNVPYHEQTPGDINDFMHPNELEAVEVYSGATTPGQFSSAGSSSCTTIVIWTKTRVGDLR
jgi:hypothetical protein